MKSTYDPPFERFRALYSGDKLSFFLNFASFTTSKYSNLRYLQYSTATYNTILALLTGRRVMLVRDPQGCKLLSRKFSQSGYYHRSLKLCLFAKCCKHWVAAELVSSPSVCKNFLFTKALNMASRHK